MPGLPKALMSQVGKGEISMKEAWARFRSRRRTAPGRRARAYGHKRHRGGYTARRKKGHGHRKKTIVKIVDKAIVTSLALFPEIRAISDCVTKYGFQDFPKQWLSQRTGYDIGTGTMNWNLLIENYVVPMTALSLYKAGKKMSAALR